MNRTTTTAFMFFSTLALACGGATSSTTSGTGGTGGGPTITISSKTFSPTNLTVPAGSTVTIQNNDSFAHTSTSQSAANAFDSAAAPGGFTFDTGDIAGNTSATITVPAGLPSGTVQPFFCKVHEGMMTPPNPTITVQ